MSAVGEGKGRTAGATPFVARRLARLAAWLRAVRGNDHRAWLASEIDREREARTGFFLLPLGLMLGILAVFVAGWRPGLLGPAAATVVLSGIALWSRRAGLRSGLLLLAAAGSLSAGLSTWELQRTDTVIFSGEATVRIEGRVAWRDRDDRGRTRYLLDVGRTDRPILSRPPKRIELLVAARHEPIPLGGDYRGLVRLRAPSGPALPGGYDFAFGSYFAGVGARGFALGAPDAVERAPDRPGLSIGEHLISLRLAMSDRIRSAIGGGEGAVASAIITGERSGIPDEVEQWLRVTGLAHVLSISGLHMALVTGFAMAMVRAGLALNPAIALRMPTKKVAAVAALGVAGFYLALSGADVAATRSFVMIAVMLLAVVADRSAVTLRNVGIAALVVLCVTPHALLTASFQMSFAATVAIIAAYAEWGRRRAQDDGSDEGGGLVRRAALAFVGIAATSILAGATTAPYSAYHFQQATPFGLIANIVALPIFSLWVMPLALIAVLAMPFGLDAPFLWLLGKGLSLVFFIVRELAERVPETPTGLITSTSVALLSIALLVGSLLTSRLRLMALPVALVGLLLVPDRRPLPDLLVFENGREVALVDPVGRLSSMRDRPNGFVFSQWSRAYPQQAVQGKNKPPGFVCEPIDAPRTVPNAPAVADGASPLGAVNARRDKPRQFCRATTRSGLRVVWTDDLRRLGRACDEADVAIVARAARIDRCQSGTVLMTLKTLRATGSAAVRFDAESNRPAVTFAVAGPFDEWNRHRAAPWPEAWRRPSTPADAGVPSGPSTKTDRRRAPTNEKTPVVRSD